MASGNIQGSIYSGHYRLIAEWSSTPDNSNNKSDVAVTVKFQADYALYVGAREVTININGVTRTITAPSISTSSGGNYTFGTCTSVPVDHNADGKKQITITVTYPIRATLSSTYYENVVASGTAVLDNIPRQANITSAPNFKDTDNPVLQYSNPAGTAVTTLQACISLDNSTDSIAYRNISKTGTSYTFQLTEAQRNVLRQSIPNSKTRTVYFIVKSVIGGNTYYSSKAVTFSIVSANPTIESISYADTNSTTTAITGNNQIIIRNNSTPRFTLTNISALKYATLTSVEITINGVTKTASLSGTSVSSKSILFNVLNVASNTTASIKVTDSRGNTKTYTKNITIADWVLPTAIISLQRESNFYSETTINIDASYSSINGENTITIKYRYKKTTANSWSSYVTAQDGVDSTFTADNNYEWNVQTVITDKLGSTTYNLILQRGVPLIYFDMIKNSTGFNCFPVGEDTVEINGEDIVSKFTGIGGIAKQVTGDWNTACSTLSGLYMGNNMSHAPSSSAWYFVLHIVHNAKYQRQLAFDFFSLNIYTRRMDNGTWGTWEQVH